MELYTHCEHGNRGELKGYIQLPAITRACLPRQFWMRMSPQFEEFVFSKRVSASSFRGLRGADRKDSRPANKDRCLDDVPARAMPLWCRNGRFFRPLRG